MDETTSTSTQETSTEVTPAQETTTTTVTPQSNEVSKSEGTTTEPSDNWEYKGDRKDVPKNFEKYVKGLDRYVSKKDQVIAEAQKKIQEYESKLSEFQKSKETTTGNVEPQKPLVTQEEIDAIALGDAKTLEAVIERKAKQLLEANVKPQLEEFSKVKESLAMERKELEAADTIKAFSEINPDFMDLLKSPVGEFMVDAARRGIGIEDIYKSAKAAETYFSERAEVKRKADLEAKRAGSVVGKSVPGTANIVYAEDEAQAKRLAIELTLKGDNRQVQIKKK